MFRVPCFMLFILIPLSLVGLGVVLAGRVVYRKIPKDINAWNEAVAKEDFGPTFYERALAVVSLKSKKTALNLSTKLVYKMKITSLKTDNFFNRLLNDIRHHKSSMATNEVTIEPAQIAPNSTDNIKKAVFKTELTSVEEDSLDLEEMAAESKTSFVKQEQQLINQLAYNPKDVSAYKRLGWLYLENNKPMEARQAFKMSVKLGSKDKVVISKLLEMGGTVHKEGNGLHKSVNEVEPTLAQASAGETKSPRQKTRKIKVRKV